MKVTKKVIDRTSHAWMKMQAAKKEFEEAEKAYKEAIAPLVAYLEDDLKLPPEKAAELKGYTTILKFGKQGERSYIAEPVEALRLLENREQGLGYANIKISMEVMKEHLALPDYKHLVGKNPSARRVKAMELPTV